MSLEVVFVLVFNFNDKSEISDGMLLPMLNSGQNVEGDDFFRKSRNHLCVKNDFLVRS